MKSGKVNHDHHPLYQQYDQALREWRQAERLWFLIKNDKASAEQEAQINRHLDEAENILEQLTWERFLSASSYFLQVIRMKQKLIDKSHFNEARDFYHRAQKLKRPEDLIKKRELYELAWQQFRFLGNFSCAAFYAAKAENQYHATFNTEAIKAYEGTFFSPRPRPRPGEERKGRSLAEDARSEGKSEEKDKAVVRMRILVEDGYDLCIRAGLPRAGTELDTTTIIVHDGVYQLNKEGKYIRLLDRDAMEALYLGTYLTQARKLESASGRRKSIRAELTVEQLHALDQALVGKGGNSLEQAAVPQETSLPTPS